MQPVNRLIDQFVPENYQLSLELRRPERTFEGTVTITGATITDSNKLQVHAKDLTIKNVTLNGKEATFSKGENDELTIAHPDIKRGEWVIAITFSGTITDAMHGLYPSYYEHNGTKKELLATQFESHHAREVFPCIDEPAAKATFDLTLTTEANVTVLSNQPIESQDTVDKKLVTTFQTTPRMSTYLLAWVVGELQHKTAKTNNGVEVSIWATPAQRTEALDFALDHSVKSIEFFDAYFGTPYPLAKCDQVALPDFSAGAMENWGLVTYRETALLADPATTTVASKHYIATVISHELSHQWFGNLVTMKWWNDLWLNESFATLMEYIAVDAIHPEWNIWLDFSSHESIIALRRDAIDGVQSVQVDVDHPDEIASLFDGAIVYAKGARLMRMCQEYIGHTAFRAGLASYFKEFAYGNTEAEDLWRHLATASKHDITDLMTTWISQSGYPVVSVTENGLSQKQFFIGPHEESSKLWPIPLGAESSEDVPALLETRELHMPIAGNERLNIKDASHFITDYTFDHLRRLLLELKAFDELGRLQLLHEQTLLARGGVNPSTELIPLLQAYQGEAAESVWGIMTLALKDLRKFVETDEAAEAKLRHFTLELARPEFEKLGWEAKEDEPESDTKLRSLIIGLMLYGEDPAVETQALELFSNGIEAIDPELRHLAISTAVKRSESDSIITALLEKYQTTHSADFRDDIRAGITSARSESQIQLILKTITDNKIVRRQDVFHWFVYMMRNRYARAATWQWLMAHWDWIEANFASDKSFDFFPQYAAGGLMTRNELDSYKAFFGPKRTMPALARSITLGITELEARVSQIEKEAPAVIAALKAL
jgi:aminopeptidase N